MKFLLSIANENKAHVVSDNVGWIILENTIAKANKYYLICVRENL